jgi:hypothetical protein
MTSSERARRRIPVHKHSYVGSQSLWSHFNIGMWRYGVSHVPSGPLSLPSQSSYLRRQLPAGMALVLLWRAVPGEDVVLFTNSFPNDYHENPKSFREPVYQDVVDFM